MSFIKKQFDPRRHTKYVPVNPQKYTGSYPLIARSSWEVIFMRYCDHNPKVISWSSENVVIPYKHPFKRTNKGLPMTSRYYPDFYLVVENSIGVIEKHLVEVKPFKETIAPKPRKNKKMKTKLYEDKTWAINSAKWKAAERYCKRMGYKFIKLTEKQLLRK